MSEEPYVPRWQLCHGRTRCQECGSYVAASWRWYATPTLSTHCYCESCVETMLAEPAK